MTAAETAQHYGASSEILQALSATKAETPESQTPSVNPYKIKTGFKRLRHIHAQDLNIQKFYKSQETRIILESVCEIINFIVDNLDPKFASVDVELTGSTAEGTKTLLPNEFDFGFHLKNLICQRDTDNPTRVKPMDTELWKDFIDEEGFLVTKDLAQAFYLSCMNAVHVLSSERRPPTLHSAVAKVLFVRSHRVSKLSIAWNGQEFEDMSISVDIALCIGKFPNLQFREGIVEASKAFEIPLQKCIYIAKITRHKYDDQFSNVTELDVSTFHFEKNILESVADNAVRDAYILAKTCRLAQIACPDDVTPFDLVEEVSLEDVITSFMLKSSLISVLMRFEREERHGNSALFWARKITNSSEVHCWKKMRT